MKRSTAAAAWALGALLGCGTESSYTVPAYDPESLKSSPAGFSTFSTLDVLSALPSLLGQTPPACLTTSSAGTTDTLTFSGCTSASGGTLSGSVSVDTAAAPSAYGVTFTSLATTRPSGARSAYTGSLDLAVAGPATVLNTRSGFQVAVTGNPTPAYNKVWTVGLALTSTQTAGGFTLQGNGQFDAGSTDSVGLLIDPAHPLTFVTGQSYPVSGTLTLTDTRPGQATPTSVTVVFNNGTVTIHGGTLTLGT